MIDANDDRATSGLRRVRSPLGLPSVRAVVGGLLVATSCLLVVAAHHAATVRHLDRRLVVRRPVEAGDVVTARDLAIAPMELPTATRSAVLADPGDAIGRITLVGLRTGDVVAASALADGPAPPGARRRVGVALDEAGALGGALRSGQRVDVIAIGTADTPTEVVATDALVADVSSGSEGLGADGRVRVVLDVDDAEVARRIVDAGARDGVSLIAPSPTPSGRSPSPRPHGAEGAR